MSDSGANPSPKPGATPYPERGPGGSTPVMRPSDGSAARDEVAGFLARGQHMTPDISASKSKLPAKPRKGDGGK